VTEGKTLAAHLGDVLTAYTGKMLTQNGKLHGLRNMLQFMVNRRLLMPQLARAADVARPTLARKFPWLTTLTVPAFGGLSPSEREAAARPWIDELAREHGTLLHVPQLPEGLWVDTDPVADLRAMMRPDATVLAVVVDPEGADQFVNPPRGMFRNPRLDEPE
jgi:hypothetical protein